MAKLTSLYIDPTKRTQEMEDFGIRSLPEFKGSAYNLGAVEGFPDVRYATTDYGKYSDLYRLYSGMPGGFGTTPETTTPETTTPAVGGGGGAGTGTTTGSTGGVNTPFEQNLLDEGAGVQGVPGDPVVAPGEMPVTQEEMDAFNKIPVTPVGGQPIDPLGMLPQIPEVVAQDPTTMIPQLGSETPSYAAGTATLEDAGAGIDDMYGTDYQGGEPLSSDQKLTTEQNNTLQNIIGQAGQTVEGAMNQLSKIPGAVADFANQTVDIFGKKFNVGKTLAMGAINKLAGGPISLVFDALGAIAPQDSLENKTKRNVVDELKKENDYGYDMQSGNLNQDPFGRNPVSAFGDYEQTLMDDLNYEGDNKFNNAKKQFAQDYFNKKGEFAGGVEVDNKTVLGPGEAPGDLVSLEQLQAEKDAEVAAQNELAKLTGDLGALETATGIPDAADTVTTIPVEEEVLKTREEEEMLAELVREEEERAARAREEAAQRDREEAAERAAAEQRAAEQAAAQRAMQEQIAAAEARAAQAARDRAAAEEAARARDRHRGNGGGGSAPGTGSGASGPAGGASSGGGYSRGNYGGRGHHWAKGGRVRYLEGGIVSLKNGKR